MRPEPATLGGVAQRKGAYQMHIYLPAWMKAAIEASAAKRRNWKRQTVAEAAIEKWLIEDGFPPPEEPPLNGTEPPADRS
jgi:hypothetical protein